MNIIISNANNEPIYEQIYRQMKTCIINGEFKEGTLLPSIRNLAKDLKISVITTKRAYEELEKNGYIFSVVGKGSFVSKQNTEILKESHLREIEALMQKIMRIAPICDLSIDNLMEMLKLLSDENI